MADLTTRVKVKRALGVPSSVTTHDDYIDDLIEVADQQIVAFCGMAAVTQTTVTAEPYDFETDYQNEFTLRNFPVISVTSVVTAGSTLTTASYYTDLRSGTIKLSNYGKFFPEGRESVKVTYVYGHATVPADLSHAATLICIAHFNASRHAGLTSEGMGSYRYSVDRRGIPAAAEAILARYRRLFPKESN